MELIRFLVVEHGADATSTTNDGWNALLLLCQHYSGSNLIQLVQLLIERGVRTEKIRPIIKGLANCFMWLFIYLLKSPAAP